MMIEGGINSAFFFFSWRGVWCDLFVDRIKINELVDKSTGVFILAKPFPVRYVTKLDINSGP